jgi:hypothetical protein
MIAGDDPAVVVRSVQQTTHSDIDGDSNDAAADAGGA